MLRHAFSVWSLECASKQIERARILHRWKFSQLYLKISMLPLLSSSFDLFRFSLSKPEAKVVNRKNIIINHRHRFMKSHRDDKTINLSTMKHLQLFLKLNLRQYFINFSSTRTRPQSSLRERLLWLAILRK
jgi:hypothetical protein